MEHFLAYLQIRTRYDRKTGGFSMDEMRLLRGRMEFYTSLEHQVLLSVWKNGSTNEAKIRARFEPKIRQISIHGYVLEYDYPIWSMKYRRGML